MRRQARPRGGRHTASRGDDAPRAKHRHRERHARDAQ